MCVNDCGAKFQRRFQQKHLDKDCKKKIISCAFCDSRFLREEKKVSQCHSNDASFSSIGAITTFLKKKLKNLNQNILQL